MGGLYSHQTVERRRYLPQANIRQNNSIFKRLSALGGSVIRLIKWVFSTIFVFFLTLGEKFTLLIKELFMRLWDIIRYNPLVRKISIAFCLLFFITGAVFLVSFAVNSPELPPENLFSTLRNIS
jgi:hypothetical protein